VIGMKTAKLFKNGRSQAVRLPKEFRFSGDEVGIKKVGSTVLLCPKEAALEEFLKSPPADDDFAEAIWAARREDYQYERESL